MARNNTAAAPAPVDQATETVAEIAIPYWRGDYESAFFPARNTEVQMRQLLIPALEKLAPGETLVITIAKR